MFIIKLLLIFVIIFGITFLFNFLLSKFLKVERRKIFSSRDYVNPLHKKTDGILRIIMAIVFFFYLVRITTNTADSASTFANTLLFFAIIGGIPDIVRSVFEWTHNQRKDAIITTSNFGFFLLIVIVFLQFEVYKILFV